MNKPDLFDEVKCVANALSFFSGRKLKLKVPGLPKLSFIMIAKQA